MTEAEYASRMVAEWARLYRALPRWVRLRLRWNRRVDAAAIWLAEHRRFGAAEVLWRVFLVKG